MGKCFVTQTFTFVQPFPQTNRPLHRNFRHDILKRANGPVKFSILPFIGFGRALHYRNFRHCFHSNMIPRKLSDSHILCGLVGVYSRY
jgi:hypothetical protein